MVKQPRMEDNATMLFQGDSVTDVSRNREDDCLNLEPTWVSIFTGTSDCWRRCELTSLEAANAAHYEGPYDVITQNPIFPEKYHIEDPFIWKTPEGYELIAKDMNGNICGEKHSGVHAFSKDGLKWDMIEGKKAYSRKVIWDDGIW